MKIDDIIIERDRHRHHHHSAASASSRQSSLGSISTGIRTAKVIGRSAKATNTTSKVRRSSQTTINAQSSKNHKNETTCTKMSDENNSISATAIAIKNGFNGATNINISSSLNSSSSSSLATVSSSSPSRTETNTVAAVTDTRIHVSRANPIHHHNSTSNNNNGSAAATATTTTMAVATTTTAGTTTTAANAITNRSISGISRLKAGESIENNATGLNYSLCKGLAGGGAVTSGSEVIGRITTATSTALTTGIVASDNGRSVQGIGGRLQFFKDGKFILELARAKEGEKSGWVSVPRKQFRSPSATSSTVTPTYPKNESSTSLSFSDDNSSIQSSPWQRDHCWKQSTPRRGISREMCFYFKRTKHVFVSSNGWKTARIKRRRPLDNSVCQTPFRLLKNGYNNAGSDVDIKSDENSLSDDNTTIAMDDEKSSDDSSTDKEGSVRESSKTPTPNSPPDTIDAPIISESAKTNDDQLKKRKTTLPNTMNGEKRLKPRAELTTIIKKLIDRLPTGLFHLSKTQIIGGANQQQHSHHTTHPTHHIASTTSRLASELHYHQQHVSPRKRILREFEKVSLEDTPAINSKRSRAKGNSPAVAPSAIVGTLPLSATPTSRVQSTTSSNNSFMANGSRTEPIITTNNSSTTRLYSSYSIHSLLGGNNNSSNSSNSTTNNNRNKAEHTTNTIGGAYNDPSYLRNMLASPKSPESCTNSKSSPYSSSASSSAKKRSPPYSPLSEIHQQYHSRNRSPNIDSVYGGMRSPPEAHSNRLYGTNSGSASNSTSRLTPPQGYLSSPKNSNSSVDGYKLKAESITNSSPNHHFYSPYMLSPRNVPPAPSSSVSPNNNNNNTLGGDNYHPKLKGARSPSQQNMRASVFRTQSPHQSTTNHSGIPRESSPIALHSSPSPGGGGGGTGVTASSSSTPRTVPKKTASIRRQFASPSSSSPSPGLNNEHSKSSSSNSNSKLEERTAMSPESSRQVSNQESAAAAAALAAANQYHHANAAAAAATAAAAAAAAAMMQRSSPLSGNASSLYYMYPPPNGSPSPHHSSSSPSPSPSSSYIPYYHPYVQTLAAFRNPLWMHHYAAASMLPTSGSGPVPQQAVPFFPYNGATATPSHLHHSSFASMHLAAAGQLGLQQPPPPPASFNRSPPTTDDTISPISIKEEHSSDVPLNLSKH